VVRLLDQAYAAAVSTLVRGRAVVVAANRIVATNFPEELRSALARSIALGLPPSGVVMLGGEPFAVLRVLETAGAEVFALDSVREASRASVRASLANLGLVGGGGVLLGAIASLWLARSLSRPVAQLSRAVSRITARRAFDARLTRTGTCREVDTLTDTFNALMHSLREAETQTRSAYVGAIKALAAALDARDPYTAGHSERVSTLSVAIGRRMRLPNEEVETLRLGALLHDIGKIGVSDNVLRKAGPLTVEEFEAIKAHPGLGARILEAVPFLAPHLPVVELHHERPDGQGYPHGLAGAQIPLLPRIVRVADAFDAMTSARAYRPARPPAEAIRELRRGAGSSFDGVVVEALVTAWPDVLTKTNRAEPRDTQVARHSAILKFPLPTVARR
jgi:HD-GYP domain-containing protein (c-di-GMP phosphodiesterase class II)